MIVEVAPWRHSFAASDNASSFQVIDDAAIPHIPPTSGVTRQAYVISHPIGRLDPHLAAVSLA